MSAIRGNACNQLVQVVKAPQDTIGAIRIVAAPGTKSNQTGLTTEFIQTSERAIMAKQQKLLKDLFLDTLKDIYFAEKKILSALPKMAKAAQSGKLRAAFEKHEAETEGQVERLEQVFASIDEPAKGKTCDAIMGIIEEGKEVMTKYNGMPALDAGLLAAAQAVEHYEISRYGTLKCWATELGYDDAVRLLDATLKEEKNTDSTLTQIAETEVNLHAETAEAA
jgi:ferritin-like metal-binding protein YciE